MIRGMGIRPIKSEVALVTEKNIACVATHAHFDHIGGHYEFDQRIVHEAEASILENPSLENTVASDYIDMPWIDAVPDDGEGNKNYSVRSAPATRTVVEGDFIDLGNRVFEVRHFPGHSPGSICLWEEKTKILFSGDVMYDGELLDELYHSNKEQYIESLERLKLLRVEVVHAGHFGSFGREKLHKMIDAYISLTIT